MTAAPRNKPVEKKIGRFYALQQEVSIPEDYILTETVSIQAPTRAQMIEFRKSTDIDVANRIFLGEAADAVFALFADRPEQEWLAFTKELYQHFYGPGADDQGKSGESSD